MTIYAIVVNGLWQWPCIVNRLILGAHTLEGRNAHVRGGCEGFRRIASSQDLDFSIVFTVRLASTKIECIPSLILHQISPWIPPRISPWIPCMIPYKIPPRIHAHISPRIPSPDSSLDTCRDISSDTSRIPPQIPPGYLLRHLPGYLPRYLPDTSSDISLDTSLDTSLNTSLDTTLDTSPDTFLDTSLDHPRYILYTSPDLILSYRHCKVLACCHVIIHNKS